MKLELLNAQSSKWTDVLASTRHDFYHLPSYLKLESERMGGGPRAILVEEDGHFFFLPLVIRKVDIFGEEVPGHEEITDGISPYGYTPPLARLPEDGQEIFMRRVLQTLKDTMYERGLVSLFVRTHPLLPIPAWHVFEEYGSLVKHGKTVWIDLAKDRNLLWKGTRKSYRYLIRNLKKEGYFVTMDEDWDHLPEFEDLYNRTMDSVNAADQYYFGIEYFKRLKKALEEKIFLCVVKEKPGNVVAAGLFTECSGIVQYHLSGTLRDPEHKNTTKLMLEYVTNWAKERGNRYFHLGGGVGSEEDSLFFFKSGFSKLLSEFYTWRMIVNEDIYQECVEIWEERSGREGIELPDFFPVYRKKSIL